MKSSGIESSLLTIEDTALIKQKQISNKKRAGKMVQQLKGLASKLDDLSLDPTWWKERTDLHV